MASSKNYIGGKSGHVTYTANLGSPNEKVQLYECRACPEGVGAVLFRFGKPIAWFIPSADQAKKIADNKRGEKINITERMLEKATIWGFGRSGGGGASLVPDMGPRGGYIAGGGGSKAQDARDTKDVKRIFTAVANVPALDPILSILQQTFPSQRATSAYFKRGYQGGPFSLHWDVINKEGPSRGALQYAVALEPVFHGDGKIELAWTWWKHNFQNSARPHMVHYWTATTADALRKGFPRPPSQLKTTIAKDHCKE